MSEGHLQNLPPAASYGCLATENPRHTARICAISKNSVHRETNSNLATFPISYYDGAERKCSVTVKILSSYHVRTETERGHTYENRTFIL